ncbi:DUF2752 domain-containing protein [Butyrivibrio sp. JL13D10]|uniref:DUF2752 domain-containing protein n=1 Tax=Butyrivibrio sp. JL13D10 TaxID=3236815 RepID=UPI0038B57809
MESLKSDKDNYKNKKIKSVLSEAAIIAGILIANSVVYALTGVGIPCVFRLFTGLKCPGCGLTHAYLALFKGNIHAAMDYNILSVTLLPVLGLFILYKGIVLIRTGDTRMKLCENIFLFLCAVVIGVFFVYRNIPYLMSTFWMKYILSLQ